jgi:hypothetical protein
MGSDGAQGKHGGTTASDGRSCWDSVGEASPRPGSRVRRHNALYPETSPLRLVHSGELFRIEYDENGYPELLAFLDRREKKPKEQAA